MFEFILQKFDLAENTFQKTKIIKTVSPKPETTVGGF